MKKIIPELKINLFLFLLTTCIIFIIPEILLSQRSFSGEFNGNTNTGSGHQADRWYFGQNAGLDFRTQDPVVDLTNYLLNVPTSPAIMADSLGEILFYTDGHRIYNKADQIMQNGDSLFGFLAITMPVIILPKPGSESLFYVFTVDRPTMNEMDTFYLPRHGLEYNVVSMALDSGRGAVIDKHKVLLEPEISSKVTAVKHSNGIDYWIVAHRFGSDEFCSFLLKFNGIDSAAYVSSHIGSVHLPPGETNNEIGYMKISPDGTKLALAIHGSGIYEIFDFNASTGQVTNAITSPPIFDDAYGIEFSPDSRFLYTTITSAALPYPVYTPPSYLFQFDLSLGASIFNSYDTIALDTSGSYFGGIQLGTDGRIYVSRSPYGNGSLSIIQNPKRMGHACNFVSNAIDLQGRTSRFGFPNFVQSYFNLPHFTSSRTAFGDTTYFTLQNNSNIDEIFWQFGDPASGSNTSSDMQPGHVFSAPGIYQVQVTEYFNGIEYATYSKTVEIINYQQISDYSGTSFYSIYPNPGDGNIMLIFKKEMKEAVICVKNMVGQQVWGPVKFDEVGVNKEVPIELPDLPEGIFMIHVNGQNADSYVSRYVLKR